MWVSFGLQICVFEHVVAKYYPQFFFLEKTPPDFGEHVVAKYYPQFFFPEKHPQDFGECLDLYFGCPSLYFGPEGYIYGPGSLILAGFGGLWGLFGHCGRNLSPPVGKSPDGSSKWDQKWQPHFQGSYRHLPSQPLEPPRGRTTGEEEDKQRYHTPADPKGSADFMVC